MKHVIYYPGYFGVRCTYLKSDTRHHHGETRELLHLSQSSASFLASLGAESCTIFQVGAEAERLFFGNLSLKSS